MNRWQEEAFSRSRFLTADQVFSAGLKVSLKYSFSKEEVRSDNDQTIYRGFSSAPAVR